MSSSVDSVSLYKMRKVLAELGTKKGRGTELVSLYIPPNKPLHEASSSLREEYGTAANIKSDTTRNHVQDALTRTMQRLKLYNKTPETGLAIFTGALPTNGLGSEVVKVYEIIPPKPIQTYLYRCDDHFHLEPLKQMLKEEKVIGILAVDATEAGIGIVTGDQFEVIEVVTSGVSGKTRAGGQSARRYERQREMELTEYYHRVARHAKRSFLEEHVVQGLIVSGPGPTKDDFLKGEYLDYRLHNNILAIVDTGYAGREGVRETLEKSEKILQDMRVVEERGLVQRFLREVNAEDGLAAYGVSEVFERLRRASVETILVSEDVGLTHLKVVCRKCSTAREKTVTREQYMSEKQGLVTEPCRTCGNTDYEVIETDFIEYISDAAADTNAKVEVISARTEEGTMLKSFGGVATILRYR